MAILLGDMLPPEERIAMGLSLQRMSIDYSAKESEGNAYTFILVKESGQIFQYEEVDFKDGICPIIQIDIGSLHVIASLISWKKIVTDIGGKSIYTVTLVQYTGLFLKPIQIAEMFSSTLLNPIVGARLVEQGAVFNEFGILQQPFLKDDTVFVSTTLVNGKIFGPSIKEIFKTINGEEFFMGAPHSIVKYNLDGLFIDSDVPDLIKMNDGRTTLYDIIQDYSRANNFTYKLKFARTTRIEINIFIPTTIYITEISFVKTGVLDENSHIAQGYSNVFDALTATHEGEIISSEQGYSVAKDFTVTIKSSKGSTTETVPGIVGYSEFGEKTKVSVVRGGPQSDFLHFIGGDIHQFWGFTSSGTLSEAPDDLNKMDKILNNQDIIDKDTYLREFMNLWGRQFVVNSTRLTEIQPFTPEQEEAVAKEEQAMIDLIEALLLYFNELPTRQLGDRYRNGQYEFDAFLDQYAIDNPDITNQAIFDFNRAMLDGPNDTVLLDPDSMVGIFDRELNSLFPHYPSVDEILAAVGEGEIYKFQGYVGLTLDSTQINLEQARTNVIIPESVQVRNMCFPSTDHPLINTSKARANWRSSDGRWPAYIELPPLPKGTPTVSFEWASKIVSTINHVVLNKKHYIRVDVRQLNNYYIITLPGQLLQTQTTGSKGENPEIKLKMIGGIENAYVPSEDTKKLYGPFIVSEGKLLDENSQEFIDISSDSVKYKINNIKRDTLVPEAFSENGTLTKEESLEKMRSFILKNYQSLNARLVWAHRFGSLTVAGMPVEEAYSSFVFSDMANINRVSVNFGIDGIKTTYYVDSPDHDNINIELKYEDLGDKEEPPQIKNEEPKIDEPKLESDPKQNTLSDKEMEYIYKKPEGGQGVIVDVEIGPFYTVRRVNYADIDSQTFAGGLNITESYFLAEWQHVRNLSEDEDSPGYLLPGTKVNVSIFSDSEFGPFIPYMEHSPEVFSPPKNV